MKKQYIIPIFVPHAGCPNECTFCNQRKISGQLENVTEQEVRNTIEYYLELFKEKKAYKEVAFFGGSFTGLEVEIQNQLLGVAYEYIKSKKIDGIRISTRPDYIDKETLKRLKKFKVKTIELGVQSTNDYILKRCRRGHTYEDVKRASRLIRLFGFTLGHQMMVGLPESTRLDELNTARELAKLKPKIVRIYPVLVIKDTELEREYLNGQFEPLELFQAVEICKELTQFFQKKRIKVIRIGLQNTDTIRNPEEVGSQVVAGPYHENMRQLVDSAYYYELLVKKIKEINTKAKEIEVTVNPQIINEIVGYKRENLQKIKEIYNLDVVVKQNEKFSTKKIEVKITKTYKEFADDDEHYSKRK